MSRPNLVQHSIDDRKLNQEKGGAKQKEQSIVRSKSLKEVQGNEVWTRGHSVTGKQSPVSYAQNPDQT